MQVFDVSYFQVQLRCPTYARAALQQQLPVAVAGALTNRVAPAPSVPKAMKSYRKRKEREAASGLPCKRNKPRTKPITCGKCRQERDQTNHTQYFGKWYCSCTETVPLEEWLAPQKRNKPIVKCGKYRKPRDPTTHKHYFGFWYCQHSATNSYEQWLAEVKAARGE